MTHRPHLDDTARLRLILAGKAPYDVDLVSRLAFTPPKKEPKTDGA